jgi:chromosome segregation ATPase
MIEVEGQTGEGLAERLRQAEADLEQLQIAYEARSRRVVDERQRLVAELEEEHELRAGYRQAIEDAQHQTRLAEAVAEDLRHTVINRDDQIAALQAHVAALEAQIAERDAHLADIEANRADLQANLDALLHSKAMRLVQPARAAFGWIRARARS